MVSNRFSIKGSSSEHAEPSYPERGAGLARDRWLGAFCMIKRFFLNKDLLSRVIFGIFILLLYSFLLYGWGLMITGLYLGNYSQAESATYFYSLIHKIILMILTGALIGTFSVISGLFYHLALMVLGKDK